MLSDPVEKLGLHKSRRKACFRFGIFTFDFDFQPRRVRGSMIESWALLTSFCKDVRQVDGVD